jgi:hypothetical protein
MEWYIRFNNPNTPLKWLKARNYQIQQVEKYIKTGIQPLNLKFTKLIENENTLYLTYINEYNEIVEMSFNTPEKIAYINRITDF